jgi:lipoprotein-anchoring transpeptidase ErfK/SrfK
VKTCDAFAAQGFHALADAARVKTRPRLLPTLVASIVVSFLVGMTASSAPIASDGARPPSLRAVALARAEAPPQPLRGADSPPEWERKPLAAPTAQQRPRTQAASLLAAIPHALPITARPGGGRVLGQMPAGSRFFGVPHVAWILDRSANGRFGKVAVPYSASRATGWIRIAGLKLSHTSYAARIDLSQRVLTVTRRGKAIMRFPVATGAPVSPTPPGRYFVTDRVPFPPDGPYGGFAFGISGIQPNLPAGWTGGDQLAIHGTNDASSIGRAVTAGCPRVSGAALERLKPVMALGTPVVFQP